MHVVPGSGGVFEEAIYDEISAHEILFACLMGLEKADFVLAMVLLVVQSLAGETLLEEETSSLHTQDLQLAVPHLF